MLNKHFTTKLSPLLFSQSFKCKREEDSVSLFIITKHIPVITIFAVLLCRVTFTKTKASVKIEFKLQKDSFSINITKDYLRSEIVNI